jgi:hypothetical protein
MKNASLSCYLFISFLLISTIGYSRNPINSILKSHNYKSEQSGCSIPVDQFDLDINNVRARLLDAGDLWWNLSSGAYQVPKGSSASSSANAIFAGSIWMSAFDQGFNLKMAALEYRQGTSDYFSGPLDNNGSVSITTCNIWDQHFGVFATDIIPCINAYNVPANNHQVPISIVCASDSNMIRWPGKGNPYLAAESYDVSGVLAPFFDANGDGIYNPLDGDYPTLKQSGTAPASQGSLCDSLRYTNCSSYADEMVFWVMNDAGNVHTSTNTSPMGIQVNALAFAFQDTNEINDMTFYTYNVINKSGTVLNQTYFSQWTDVDLGCANNDRVGCDTSRNMAIQYNGYVQGALAQNNVTCDEGSLCPAGTLGYGCDLPMIGIMMLQGATDTILDAATHQPKQYGMTSFSYFTNGAATGQSDPTTAAGFRNYQVGFWNDGSPITYAGNGYNGTIHFPYCFPGDPALGGEWSECNPQTGPPIAAGDRRFVQTTGPFTFMPCASQFFSIAVVFVQPPGGVASNCPSWSFIDTVADKAKALFNNCFQHQDPVLTSIQNINEDLLKAYPNPVSTLLYIASGKQPIDEVYVYDLMGRLVIHQATKSSSVDMSTLNDGIYFVKTNKESEQSFKIVKK